MATNIFVAILSALVCVSRGDVPKDDIKPKLTAKELTSMGDAALSKGDVKSALNYYGQLIRVEPTQLNYFKRGDVLLRKKEYARAIEDFTSSIQKDGKFIKAFISRANSYLLTGECDLATADYKTVLNLKPAQKEAMSNLPKAEKCSALLQAGQHYLEKGQPDRAKEQLDEAFKISYESAKVLLLRSQAHMVVRDYQSVLVDTRQALKIDGKNLEALLLRGNAYYLMGDHEIAAQHYREGMRADPEHSGLKEAAKQLKRLTKASQGGEDALKAQKYPEAMRQFREALEVDPSNEPLKVKLNIKLCEAMYKGGQAQQAIAVCTQAIDLDNNNIDAWMRRADAKIEAELFDEAIKDYTQATQIDGNNREAQEGLMRAKKAEKMASRKDYYKILGVKKDATTPTIKKVFRKMALELHPDKQKEEEEKKAAELKFREVVEAYEVLSDSEKRQKYDSGEDIQIQQPQGNPFQHFFHQGGQQFHFQWG